MRRKNSLLTVGWELSAKHVIIMTKFFFRFLLIALFANMSIAMNAGIIEVQIGDFKANLEYVSKRAELKEYIGSATEVAIPASLSYNGEEYTVTSLGSYCFWGTNDVVTVTIPSTVTSISQNCFSCSSLQKLTIPSSVTSLGENFIFGCSALEELSVEPGNTVYDSRDNCNAVIETATNVMLKGCKTTVIPGTVTSLGVKCFIFSSIETITIPESVTSIGNSCFGHCDNLKSVIMSNSVKSMGDECFSDCESLETVTLSSSLTKIGFCCFQNCYALKSINIPEAVTSFVSGCFSSCI